MRKAVQDMTSAELLEEAARRDENRRLGRPLDYIDETPTPEQLAAGVKRKDVLEKEEQRVIRNMALALGFKVYWLSQAKQSKQTPGLPDLWLACEAVGLCGWWETKRQVGGSRSSAQEDFADECKAGRIPYGFGDRYEFARWLRSHGFIPPAVPQE